MIPSTATPLPCPDCGRQLSPGTTLCAACALDDVYQPPDGLGWVGGFRLIEMIGRGGMGLIYRAWQSPPEREVALKVLPGQALHTEEARARFRLEAQALGLLDHPHILPVYESGEDEGAAWIAMKLANGGTLASRQKSLLGKWATIAELIHQAAEAVHHAHGRGVLHRDLKPSNLLFDETGALLVADFGLAKLTTDTESKSRLTRSQVIMGTPQYMAPEVAEGLPAEIRSDVWSLGVMLYEALTGALPFEGETSAVILRKMAQQELAPIAAQVPRDLRIITLKCLQQQPSRRYASAGDLAADLARWLHDEPIQARKETWTEQWSRRVRRNPLAASLIGLMAITLGLAGIFQWKALQTARLARDETRHINERLRLNLYAADLIAAQQATQANNSQYAGELLAAYRPSAATQEADLRGWAWHWLRGQLNGDPHEVIGTTGIQINDIEVLPDGSLISAEGAGAVRRWPGAQGPPLLLTQLPTDLQLSQLFAQPDGSWLGGGMNGLSRFRLDAAQPPTTLKTVPTIWWHTSSSGEWAVHTKTFSRTKAKPPPLFLTHLPSRRERPLPGATWCGAFTPDGLSLITALADGGYARWTGPEFTQLSGQLELPPSSPAEPCWGLAFDPQGQNLAASLSDGSVLVWKWPSGALHMRHSCFDRGGAWDPVLSVDGRWLAVGGSNQEVAVVDLIEKKQHRSLRGHGSELQCVNFSPDSRELYSTARDGALFRWLDWQAPTAVPHPAFVGPAHFTADSQHMVCTDKELPVRVYQTSSWREVSRFGTKHQWPLGFTNKGAEFVTSVRFYNITHWDWRTGTELRRIMLQREEPKVGGHVVALSPDGQWLVGGTIDGRYLVWEVASGRIVHTLTGHTGEPKRAWFSPSGRALLTTTADRQPRLWRTADWSPIATLQGHGHLCEGASFDEDQARFATACYDGVCRIWSLTDGRLLRQVTGQTTSIGDVKWLPDGHSLALLQNDQSVLLFDSRTWRQTIGLQPQSPQLGHFAYLSLTPDGRILLASDNDGKASAAWRW